MEESEKSIVKNSSH